MDIVDRIDLVLELRKQKRQDLADYLGITYQAIGNWKKKKGLPVVDTAMKIAGFLQVELSWLVYGELYFDNRYPATPKDIANRIIIELKKVPNHPEDIPHLITPISAWVNVYEFINWMENRKIPDYDILFSISKDLGLSYQYLVTGVHEEEKDPTEHLKKLANRHSNFLMTFDAMYERDQHYIDMLCRRMFKLKRQIDGNDFVYPIDPDNPKAQADPNADVQ